MNSQPAIPVGKNRSRTRSVGVGVGGGRRFAFDPRLTLAIVLIAMIVLFAILQPVFLTSGNLLNILRLQAVPMILAVGMTMVVLTGGADLSVGSALALSGIVAGILYLSGMPIWVVIGGTVLFGAVLGAANGFLVGIVGMSFFVVTLGTLSAYRSLALVASDGSAIQMSGERVLLFLGDGSLGWLPVPVLITAIIVLLGYVALAHTGWGRRIYAVGSNPEAARLSGIRVGRVLFSVYLVSGLLAGVAAVIQVGRLTSASPLVGQGLELQVIAAVLLGGTVLSGGSGGLGGTIIAVLLLGVLQNGLTLSGVPDYWQGAITGAILIIAVYLDHVQRKQRSSFAPMKKRRIAARSTRTAEK
jgi:ribose transport system permease protein